MFTRKQKRGDLNMPDKDTETLTRVMKALSKLDKEKQSKAAYFIEGMAAVREDEKANLKAKDEDINS